MGTPRMSQPFQYAFFVRDLSSTRQFYSDILGCPEGRSTDTWVDFDFFGNQISAHTTGPVAATHNTGQVVGIQVPMPHFGALLEWDALSTLADRIRDAGITFILEPRIRYAGQPGEQATMFLLDPSGNALEFKSFRHPEHVFTA
jgi:extradiol dioxygenase family protein